MSLILLLTTGPPAPSASSFPRKLKRLHRWYHFLAGNSILIFLFRQKIVSGAAEARGNQKNLFLEGLMTGKVTLPGRRRCSFLQGSVHTEFCSLIISPHRREVRIRSLQGPEERWLRKTYMQLYYEWTPEDGQRTPRASSKDGPFPENPPFSLPPSPRCLHLGGHLLSVSAEAASPPYCIINASLGHVWKHMCQDRLF